MIEHVLSMIHLLQEYVRGKEKETQEEIVRLEAEVDQFEKKIEDQIFDLFSLQQPQFTNLVYLLCVTRVIRDLERVGDQVINFITMFTMSNGHPLALKEKIINMLSIGVEMLTEVRVGAQKNNQGIIQLAIEKDDLIDKFHLQMYSEVVEQMKTAQLTIDIGSQMIIMLRFVERMGDHIVNIGEAYQDYIRLCN